MSSNSTTEVSGRAATARESDGTPLLEVEGIGKRFPGVIALDNVGFYVQPGEIIGLIGENGAGKSTLMKVLGGVHQPDTGTIKMDDKPVTIRSVSDSLSLGISFIHQELNVLDNIDVAGNVFLGREPTVGPLRLLDRARMYREADVLLQRVGLDISSRTLLSELSLAQQQMVEIAKALSLNARLLIMDEPTSSLTLTETERLLDVARDLRAHGVSIIYISHRLHEIVAIADRVVGLRDGRSVGSLSRDEITHDHMVSLMVGRDLERYYAAPDLGEKAVGLSVENLRSARYPTKPVSFEVRKGEILGMAGLVGAGRSELARTVFGVDRAAGGTVSFEGKPLQIRSTQDAISAGIFLAPEDRRATGLITSMLIRENITLPDLNRFAPGGLIRRSLEVDVAEKYSKRLNVKTPSIEVQVSTLSGGNQQKVVLAKWLALGPKVLIFDEPTRGIDVGAKAEIYQLMRSLAQEGVAIWMISSDMEEVLGVSDRVAVMHEGSITGILNRGEASEQSIMALAVGAVK
jgi:ribose transport system ATP-binding protein